MARFLYAVFFLSLCGFLWTRVLAKNFAYFANAAPWGHFASFVRSASPARLPSEAKLLRRISREIIAEETLLTSFSDGKIGGCQFCCATKVAPLRNTACFVAQQTVCRCARRSRTNKQIEPYIMMDFLLHRGVWLFFLPENGSRPALGGKFFGVEPVVAP